MDPKNWYSFVTAKKKKDGIIFNGENINGAFFTATLEFLLKIKINYKTKS